MRVVHLIITSLLIVYVALPIPAAADDESPSPAAAAATQAVSPPENLEAKAVPCVDLQEPAVEKAAADKAYRWQKRTIRVAFLDGSNQLRQRVADAAKGWEEPSGLRFEFVTSGPSDIRISFRHRGHYSYIGTVAERIPNNQHTMNLQFTDATDTPEVKMITLHEFGHALGLIHEHQSPESEIQWNIPAVMDYYQGPPNRWGPEQVYSNVIEKYKGSQSMRTSGFDRNSIMLYPIDRRFTTNGFSSTWNIDLSATDRAFIREFYRDVAAVPNQAPWYALAATGL